MHDIYRLESAKMETFHLEPALIIFKFYLPVEGRWRRPKKGLKLGGGGLIGAALGVPKHKRMVASFWSKE